MRLDPAALAIDVVLEPASNGVERVANCDVRIFVRMLVVRAPTDHDLTTGEPNVDGNVEQVALAMMLVGRSQRDPATDDLVEVALEALHVLPHIGLDGGRGLQVLEVNLQRYFHATFLRLSRKG